MRLREGHVPHPAGRAWSTITGIFEPEKGYRTCDFIVWQYRLSKGDVKAFRDGGLALARRSGIAIAFSLNILHGGDAGDRLCQSTATTRGASSAR